MTGRKNRRRNEVSKETSQFKCDPADDYKPDWEHECSNCGAKPIVPASGMCGPCTFGEADTAGGNW